MSESHTVGIKEMSTVFFFFKNITYKLFFAQSAEDLEYTDSFSAEVYPHPKSVLNMTLNNLMVRFRWCWNFAECRLRIHCNHSQILSGPE